MKQTENERIKILREALGVTQKEMAGAIGIDTITISKIETGAQSPSAKTLRKISDVFNVRLDWMADGKGDIFISGSAEENRKTAMSKGTTQSSEVNPWKDALVEQLRKQNELLNAQIEKLSQAVLNMSSKNFLNGLNYAASSQNKAA